MNYQKKKLNNETLKENKLMRKMCHLNIKYKKEDGTKEFAHTLNNTVVAPPRMLIALLENNYQEDGSVLIPKPLRPYMGGKEKIIPNK